MITPKVRKPELSILYATGHLVLIYISTKYHQNIRQRIQVTERTRSLTPTPTGSVPKTISPTHFGRGGGGDIIINLLSAKSQDSGKGRLSSALHRKSKDKVGLKILKK